MPTSARSRAAATTPGLVDAMWRRDGKAFDDLLRSRASPDEPGADGLSAMHLAARHEGRTRLEGLLAHGGDPSVRDTPPSWTRCSPTATRSAGIGTPSAPGFESVAFRPKADRAGSARRPGPRRVLPPRRLFIDCRACSRRSSPIRVPTTSPGR
jgi:hypothetical protein